MYLSIVYLSSAYFQSIHYPPPTMVAGLLHAPHMEKGNSARDIISFSPHNCIGTLTKNIFFVLRVIKEMAENIIVKINTVKYLYHRGKCFYHDILINNRKTIKICLCK